MVVIVGLRGLRPSVVAAMDQFAHGLDLGLVRLDLLVKAPQVEDHGDDNQSQHGFYLLPKERGLAPSLLHVAVDLAGAVGRDSTTEALDLVANLDLVTIGVGDNGHAVDLNSIQAANPFRADGLTDHLLEGARPRASAGAGVKRQVRIGPELLLELANRDPVAKGLAERGLADLANLQHVVADYKEPGLEGAVVANDLDHSLASDTSQHQLAGRAMDASAVRGRHSEPIALGVMRVVQVVQGGELGCGGDGGIVLLHGITSS